MMVVFKEWGKIYTGICSVHWYWRKGKDRSNCFSNRDAQRCWMLLVVGFEMVASGRKAEMVDSGG